MTADAILVEVGGGVGRITLNRPEAHNAFDDAVIAGLADALGRLEGDATVRVVVLAANGRSFSAGADLGWMRRMAGHSVAENLADARALAAMVRTLDRLSKPTVALVQGPAFGGGVGLVACCDVAIASEAATFMLSEVRLGIIPSVISPYVVAAVGPRQARRLFVTAERIDAAEALRIGLVHRVVAADALAAVGDEVVAMLAHNGPAAMAAAKELVSAVAGRPVDDALVEDTARRIADMRAGAEGREGLAAFLEKRRPAWDKG